MLQSLIVFLLTGSPAFSQSITNFHADYVLPAAECETTPEESRRFAVDYFVIQKEGEADRTVFKLPQDLTGKRILVDMSVAEKSVGADGVPQKKLVGAFGEAQCRGPWAKMQCSYRFDGLSLNPSETNEFLAQKYGLDSLELQNAKDLARRFESDPVGEIQTEMKSPVQAPIQNCAF